MSVALVAVVIGMFDTMSFRKSDYAGHAGRGFRDRPGSSLGVVLDVKDAIPRAFGARGRT